MMNDTYVAALASLETKGLVESAARAAREWLTNELYQEFQADIIRLIETEQVAELNDAFYKVIPFGTGGRRGKMGPGTNRINTRTIAESAQGFANYLKKHFGEEEVKRRGMVITYDVRHNSRLFAEVAASVFAANGITVYFFDGVRATPQISFTIRYKHAVGGAMISASHNPPTDNGIKVYWETGGQVVPPHDMGIISEVEAVRDIATVDFVQAVKDGQVVMLGVDADQAYHDAVANLSLGSYRDVHIVFTPLHGCATTSFLPVLQQMNFARIDLVTPQMVADPEFSAVEKQTPNPEVPIAMTQAVALAKASGADLALAADPDADRIGVVARTHLSSDEYVFFNGNQISVLLFDYITSELKKQGRLPTHGVMVKTIVTTELLTKIAQDNGIEVIPDLPVGFKYISDAIETRLSGKTFLFGAEESHGYLYGNYAREKDGAVGAMLISEYVAKLKAEGKTVFERLEEIKKQYGYFRELLQAIYYQGMDGMDKMLTIMNNFRTQLPTEIDGHRVHIVLDQLTKKFVDPTSGEQVGEYVGFPDNALVFYLNEERTKRIVARPSGTEPKIKFYVAIGEDVGMGASDEAFAGIKKRVDDMAFAVLEDVVCRAEKISSGGNRYEMLG